MKSFIVKTMIAGILLVIPLFFVSFAVARMLRSLRTVVAPVVEQLGIDSALGLIVLNVLAVLALITLVFLIGLLAYVGSFAKRIETLDSFLSNRVPGYAMVKGILSGTIPSDSSVSDLKVVMVQHDGMGRIGFEVERVDSQSVMVYLPNVPNPQSGIAAAFHPDNVKLLDIPPHKVLEMLSFFGRGIGKEVAKIKAPSESAQ